MYLEGSDQHRGWFQSSLLLGTGAFGRAPYQSVVCCGFTVDENGEKMSKSKGNGIDPAEVTGKYGADVLRLWVASTDYSVDVSIGDTILQRTSDAYRRFRNTFRFLLGSLSDFDSEKDAVAVADMPPVDVWALLRLRQMLADVEKGYDEYRFHQVFRTLYEYVISDLSAIYMDVAKDRLYSEAPDSPARRSAQTVLDCILEVMVRVMSPILSFTCDEVWEHYPEAARNRAGRPVSVQLAGWPAAEDFPAGLPEGAEADAFMARFSALLATREAVTKALEEARNAKTIGKGQEAALVIEASAADAEVLSTFSAADLTELFIVAEGRDPRVRRCRRWRAARLRGQDRASALPALLEPSGARRQRRASGRVQALRRRPRRHRLRRLRGVAARGRRLRTTHGTRWLRASFRRTRMDARQGDGAARRGGAGLAGIRPDHQGAFRRVRARRGHSGALRGHLPIHARP